MKRKNRRIRFATGHPEKAALAKGARSSSDEKSASEAEAEAEEEEETPAAKSLEISDEPDSTQSGSSQVKKQRRKSSNVDTGATPSEKRRQRLADKRFETGNCQKILESFDTFD